MSFCSRAALSAHETMAGTGVVAQAYVFLPVAKRFWRTAEVNASWASADEQAAIKAARQGGVVTRLYDPPRGTDDTCRILVYSADAGHQPAALQPLLDVFAGRWLADESRAPRLAVCTHGTRDRCCAKWGFAVFSAARDLHAAGLSPFEPIQCSHLGGDRFAATGVFFPSGSMYAHLDSADLRAMAQGEAAGRLTPELYRGRVFEPALTQVLRAGLARAGVFNHASLPLDVVRRDPATAEARVDGKAFEIALDVTEVRFFGSCGKMAEGKPSTARRLVVAGVAAL
ncbi:sucrase ferredoxin [Phenylobacterium deserti]|uniref:Sucrase ferredoxin n=1 Tax=Phenylobacterium deserti TaxID=1914756 RepID=A0A328AE52_9CAUL|nr:sucrase ferredoxin [Phenylobacterium deserti]RAK52496.1 hypothetical protein DJ018_09790 [Phenylobacterium deserti]